MKTKHFQKCHRMLHNGGRLYGRQWIVKSSRQLGSDAYATQKVLWPVYL